jgi:rubrerythrin
MGRQNFVTEYGMTYSVAGDMSYHMMGEVSHARAREQWKCAYCGTVTSWRDVDPAPKKCPSCGAYRGMGEK